MGVCPMRAKNQDRHSCAVVPNVRLAGRWAVTMHDSVTPTGWVAAEMSTAWVGVGCQPTVETATESSREISTLMVIDMRCLLTIPPSSLTCRGGAYPA